MVHQYVSCDSCPAFIFLQNFLQNDIISSWRAQHGWFSNNDPGSSISRLSDSDKLSSLIPTATGENYDTQKLYNSGGLRECKYSLSLITVWYTGTSSFTANSSSSFTAHSSSSFTATLCQLDIRLLIVPLVWLWLCQSQQTLHCLKATLTVKLSFHASPPPIARPKPSEVSVWAFRLHERALNRKWTAWIFQNNHTVDTSLLIVIYLCG